MASSPHLERDSFKDRLTEFINLARSKTSTSGSNASDGPADKKPPVLSISEIKARQALLQRDPQLARLHRDLVRAGHLSEEEFWETRSHLLKGQLVENSQVVGLSTELLHDIRPTSTEGTDIKYTLSPQDIQSIFLHYPSLKRAFDENVPEKMTEKDFWIRCFQSSFFYRDRKAKAKKDPVFDKAAQEEEAELNRSVKPDLISFLLDLTESDRMDEYSNELDPTMKLSKSSLSLPLIRRYNRHGDLVVKAITDSPKHQDQIPKHKQVLREVMTLEDLQPPIDDEPLRLNLKSELSYFESGSTNNLAKVSKQDWISSCQNTFKNLSNSLNGYIDPDPSSCYKILQTISESNELGINPTSMIPADTLQDMLTLNLNSTEILRHFWASIPPTKSEESKKKFRRMEKLVESAREKVSAFTEMDELGV